MIFVVRCQPFVILSVICILVGSTLVGNCQADRTPASLDSRSFFEGLVEATDVDELKRVKRVRQRDEKLWREFKQFAGVQASVVKHKLAGLDLRSWWKRRSVHEVSPAVQKQTSNAAEVGVMSATAMVTHLAANMTALQWWQASSLTADLLDSGHHRVERAKSKIDADFQASFVQLVKSASINIVNLANSHQVGGVIRAMTVATSSGSSKADLLATSSDENPEADPYWQYYADCDFWGAQFESAKE